jgi:UDP-glucose 4-epimerase
MNFIRFGAYTYDMSLETWIITGGAGYIGSHVADLFIANNKKVVIYDSLYHGLESRIAYLRKKYNKDVPLVVADIRNTAKFEEVLVAFKPHGIIHMAALKSVSESMDKRDEYFEVNHSATSEILELLKKHKVQNFIFSSSAAVYGPQVKTSPIKENDSKTPISPYGESKLAAEEEATKFFLIPGNRGTSLRFFNAIGSSSPELEDNSRDNLVPIAIGKIKAGQPPLIFGTDYPTPDGTCIRDYVDVRDIARVHLAVADSQAVLPLAMNLGSGIGHSVREVIAMISNAMGSYNLPPREASQRVGDAPVVKADVALLETTLKFSCKFNLAESIGSINLMNNRQIFKLKFRNRIPRIVFKIYRISRNKKNSALQKSSNRKFSSEYSAMITARFPEFLNKESRGLVLDLGANVGHFSSACLNFGLKVKAVEPHPDALKQLRNRFRDSTQVEIIPMAVGTTNGTTDLILHPHSNNDPIATSIAATVIPDKFTGERISITVPTIAISTFFTGGQIYELVKIDIEGAEFQLVPDLIKYSLQIKRLLLETHDRFMCDSVMSNKYTEQLKMLRDFIDDNNLSKRWLTDWV